MAAGPDGIVESRRRVPAMLMGPEKLLVPLSVAMPLPVLLQVKPPPLSFIAPLTVMKLEPGVLRVKLLVMVMGPEKEPDPSAPARLMLLATVVELSRVPLA